MPVQSRSRSGLVEGLPVPSHGNAAAGSNVRSPVAQVNGPGRVTSTAPPAGVETTWAPAKGAGHEWADIPASRGRDDAKGSFGSVCCPSSATPDAAPVADRPAATSMAMDVVLRSC